MGGALAMANSTMVTAKDGRQHSWGSIKLLLATLIVSTLGDGFCGVMMSVALPDISETYHISLSVANWVTVGYAIVAATAVMCAATVLARYGLRKLFFFSRVLLIVSSVIGLFSLNFPMMLGSRLIQAVGSGLMFPTINTVIIRIVPERYSGRIVSLNSAIIGLGIAVAPLLSGLFLTYVSLTSMYVVPLVIGIISLAMGVKFMFDVEARQDRRIDLTSVLLAFIGLTMLMLGFSELTHRTLMASCMLMAGLVVLAWFTMRQLHMDRPLLNIHPLKHLSVSIGVVMYIMGGMGQQAVLLLLPLYLERACDYSDAASGGFLLIVALIYSGVTLVAGKSVDSHGIWPVLPIGFLVLAVGMLAVFGIAPLRNAWLIAVIAGVAASGYALVNVPDKDVVLESVPDTDTADVSSVFSTGAQIASSIGSALFVGILSADVLHRTAEGVNRHAAYAYGFQHSVLVGAIIEGITLVVAVWYAREMVKHGKARN